MDIFKNKSEVEIKELKDYKPAEGKLRRGNVEKENRLWS